MAFNKQEDWLSEFTEFSKIDSEKLQVPPSVLKGLKKRLFPNPWIVFGRVAVLHAIVGSLSLGICHQFGMNPFQTERSLMDIFMRVGGHHFCMLACGVFFVASTFLLANFFLTLEELEAIRRQRWLQIGVLGLVSLTAFYFLGAELVVTFAALWGVGVFVGGLLSIEGSYRCRRSFA